MKKLAFMALTLLAALNGHAAPPYTFSAGGSIRASEINANFTYLDTLISSSGLIKPDDLIHTGGTFTTGAAASSVYTVPANAARNYVIRTFTTNLGSAGKTYLTVGSATYTFDTMTNTNLMIPVVAGEAIQVSGTATNNASFSVTVGIVVSK